MKTRATFSIEKEVLNLLITMAENDHRSKSNMLEVIIREEHQKRTRDVKDN
jgi:hypothetical protein